MSLLVDFAKSYSRVGFDAFPCKSHDKTPAVRWADVATKEENMLVGWFDTQPNSNIGIACGRRSGIIVLDVDKDHDGFYSLADLTLKYGDLPITPTVKTGTGGEHYYFKHPGFEIRNSAGKLGPGLDIRGDGGYVVAPPSIHPNGNKYEWVVKPKDAPFADMPQWMIELLTANNLVTETIPQTGDITSGGRNNALTQLAGSMRRKGHSEDGIFAALQVFNRERCAPPLTDGEVLQIARSVSRYEPQDEVKIEKPLPTAWDVIDNLEAEIKEREKNPKDVWGVHYAWPFISLVTGGKQKGELIILAGEPGVGKSWWAHQDALFTAIGNPSRNIPSTPTGIWSGEMKRKQIYRRFFEMLGVPKRHMLTGQMSNEDWQFFNEAKAVIVNSPIYISDAPLRLKDTKALLEREISEHGIEQWVFDYDWLIDAPGDNEIATSQNISRTMKQLAHDLNISIVLISSVNKGGMDTASANTAKSSVSGSGKKLHDADIIYILTKFDEKKTDDMLIKPDMYKWISTLHISKGRELDFHIPNGIINYMRETPNPKFKELKNMNDPKAIPSWIDRKDIA